MLRRITWIDSDQITEPLNAEKEYEMAKYDRAYILH